MTIYCDEAGYSGDNLLEEAQPYFVYCGINLTDIEIQEIHKYIYKNYHVQGDEIKGNKIVQTGKGKMLIKELFNNYSKSTRIVYSNKKYALAAKIFEYALEPLLDGNSKYYQIGFHKFIATYLYSSLSNKDANAEEIFRSFLKILRGKDINSLFAIDPNNTSDTVCKMILEIAANNAKKIYEEITTEGEIDKWILDLTMTSLMGILTEWNKFNIPLKVICDDSNLFINNTIFERLNDIGLSNATGEFIGNKIGFHLSEPIILENSKLNFGIQIADLFASTVSYCLRNPGLDFSRYILARVANHSLCTPNSWCIVPNYQLMNVKDVKTKFFPILQYLHNGLTQS